MRHPSVNVTKSKLLHVKIVAVNFVILFFMLMFAAQQLKYSQIDLETLVPYIRDILKFI